MAKKKGAATVAAKMEAVEPKLKPVEIPVQSMMGVLSPTFQDAVNAEHWFYNQGQNVTFLSVYNASDEDVALTFANAHPDFIKPRIVTVEAKSICDINMFNPLQFNDITNKVYFELSHCLENLRFSVRRVGI